MTFSFGEILHKLLDITNEKNFRLAHFLGYDVTYISKWINGNKLPSHKNITEIIDKICNFFIDDLDKNTLRQICYEFEIHQNSNEEVKKELSTFIYDCFENQKISKHKDNLITNNSCIMLNSKDTDGWIFENLKHYCKKSKEKDIHIIITNDINNYSNKKSVLDISENKGFVFNSKNVYIYQLINLEKMKNNINEYCKIILLYLNSNSKVTYNLYVDNNEHFNLILVKNCLSSMSIKDQNCNLNMNVVSRDLDTINNLYKYYSNHIRSQTQLYEVKSCQELVEQKYLLNFVMQNDIKLIFRNMHSIGISENILLKIKEDNNLYSGNIDELFSIMNICLKNMKLKIIIYKSALLTYIFDGAMNIYNESVIVSKKDRISHLKKIITLLKSNNQFEIKLIEDDNEFVSISDLDSSVFISNQSCFAIKDSSKEALYFKFINKDIINYFNKFFNNIWNSQVQISSSTDVINFIEKGIELLSKDL